MKLRESIYKRYTPANICEQKGSGNCYWFVFSFSKLLVTINDDDISIPFIRSIKALNIVPVRTQYLGILEGQHCYSVEVFSDENEPEGMEFKDLRSLYGQIEEDMFFLAGIAMQIVNWDQTHQYCGRCGSDTYTKEGERAKCCPTCGLINYPRISPAIIVAIIKEDKILLAHNNSFSENMYSVIAGFLEPGETLEECVQREIMEEVGLKVKTIKYFGSQPWSFSDSIMVGYIAEYESGEIVVDGVEITDAGWFGVDNLPEIPSKLSIARKLIDWYIEKYSEII